MAKNDYKIAKMGRNEHMRKKIKNSTSSVAYSKPEKTDYGWTDGQMDGEIDRQTDRQKDRHVDGRTDTQMGGQKGTQKDG